MSVWTLLGLAFGGALFLEGAMWALFPDGVRKGYRTLLEEGNERLQVAGMVSAAVGTLVVALAIRGFG